MSHIATETIGPLVDELVAADELSLPVRLLDDLIAAGEAAVEPLAELVREVHNEHYRRASVWAAMALGQLRAAAAAPVLAEAIARSPQNALTFRVPAAEALAEIGAAALPALRSLAASEDARDRLWAYYAAGLMRAAAAFDFLLAALAADATMPDAIACALADHGNAAAIGALYDALARAEPWQRSDIETAIRDLHHGVRPEHTRPRNWRIRYRTNALFGKFPMSWAALMALTRHRPEHTARGGPPVRSLDEILAEPETAPERRCRCCGVPQWSATGVPVCPRTAAVLPLLQADLLRRRRDADGTDDIFELLDGIDADILEAAVEPERESRRARERQEDHRTNLRLMQAALIWAVELDADSAGAARAMLLAEAGSAARQHGDPLGVFQRVQPRASPGTARAGRNDPCPCGSGRKYKKCCGTA